LLSDKLKNVLGLDENHINYGENFIELTNLKFVGYSKEDNIWPVCVGFYEKKSHKKYIEKNSLYSGELAIYIDLKYLSKEDADNIEDFIIKENQKCNPRNNEVLVEKFDQKPDNDDIITKLSERYGTLEKIASLIS
jgi:hypothetical protein